MKRFLFVVGILAGISGLYMMSNAQSAIHEIDGGIALLTMATAFAGAGIIGAVEVAAAKIAAPKVACEGCGAITAARSSVVVDGATKYLCPTCAAALRADAASA